MSSKKLGGIIHTYQKDDPVEFPSPTAEPPDLVLPGLEHMLFYLEQLWYAAGDEQSPFARALLQLMERLGEKYQVDELAAKYDFTGDRPMTVPEALEIKRELEKIDELLKQLREAKKTAQIGIIDMEALSEFAEPGDVQQLSALQQQIQDYLRELAERQGL